MWWHAHVWFYTVIVFKSLYNVRTMSSLFPNKHLNAFTQKRVWCFSAFAIYCCDFRSGYRNGEEVTLPAFTWSRDPSLITPCMLSHITDRPLITDILTCVAARTIDTPAVYDSWPATARAHAGDRSKPENGWCVDARGGRGQFGKGAFGGVFLRTPLFLHALNVQFFPVTESEQVKRYLSVLLQILYNRSTVI